MAAQQAGLTRTCFCLWTCSRGSRVGGGSSCSRFPSRLESVSLAPCTGQTCRASPVAPSPAAGEATAAEAMLSLDRSAEPGGWSLLLEAGTEVNAPADAFGQSPAHLAACAGQAFFLLWQLQTGANLNQQDCHGETPIHKAAKVGSLECLALLVASDARIDLRNNDGQTAEDIAWAFGFLECVKYLRTVKHTQNMKLRDQSSYSLKDSCDLLREASAGQKRACGIIEPTNRKRRRSDGTTS